LIFAALLASVACDRSNKKAPEEVTLTQEPIPAGTIAFNYKKHLYFDAIVRDSIPARLIFDSGATGLYVDSLWLANSGIEPKDRQVAYIGGTGKDLVRTEVLFDTLDFRIDSIHLKSRMTVVLQLKDILGRHADGIFGQEYLAKECVEFNYRHGYMRRVLADTLAAAGFVRHPVRKHNYRIYLRARVELDAERAVEGEFTLDTGSGSGVTLTSAAARKAGFDSFTGNKVANSTLWGGIGGGVEGVNCRADSVVFYGHRFSGVPVGVSKNKSGYLADGDGETIGLIGNEFLERFDVVIDFAAPALWLRPAENFDAPWPFMSAGFKVVDRTDIYEGWIVSSLYEQPHAPVGLRFGDVVVTWDGVPVTGLDRDSVFLAPGPHRVEAMRDGVRTEYEFETKEIL
jgi:hypothetical protein